MDFAAFFSLSNMKRFWAPLFLLVFIVAVFFGGTMLSLYRRVKALPGVSALPLPVK